MDTQDFDLLISKYSDDLMQLKEKWSERGIVTEEKKEDTRTKEEASAKAEEETEAAPSYDEQPTEQEAEEEPSQAPDEENMSDYPKAAPESYARFTARVFSGEGVYPVAGAKVMIYREGRLHTFLITDENGETPTVKIESAPAENALIPNSDDQQLDYLADIYADGFTPEKGLLVSAVGDSHILLTVQLTPLSERID